VSLHTLDDWLAHCERLHPVGVDMTLERVRAVYRRLDIAFDAAVIVVAGTNGKGSTCAFLESIALAAGWRVGLHIKPHLVRFEERCRVNGAVVAGESLLEHFAAVEAARGDITLTYFEFTLLAILRRFAHEPLDLVILEVGLGGRLDAVNIVDGDCAVITNIALDHVDYLGPDRESIGREKAHVMRAGRPAVVGDPQPPASVIAHAQAIGADLWLAGRDFRHDGDRQQWRWQGRTRRYAALACPALRGANQLLNASAALAAFEALHERLPISAQAVRQGLARIELAARFQIVPGQPALVLDVAHNAQAAGALAVNLDQMGFYPRTFAVFGAMRDKDLAAIVAHLQPLIERWFLTDLPTPRAASAAELRAHLPPDRRNDASCHANPAQALAAAIEAAHPADRIVVFGSFYTVGGVLKEGLPRLAAPHTR
jgi:dihydrofolate synthase/folylpolyglutamate synthase